MLVRLLNGVSYKTHSNVVFMPNYTIEWMNERGQVLTIKISQVIRIEE